MLHNIITPISRSLTPFCYAVILLCCTLHSADAAIEQTSINKANSLPVYTTQEKQLGEFWLRAFRGGVSTINDPLIEEYTDEVLQRLTRHNDNNFGDISLVIVNNPDINAFAVPGSVIGINLGIFRVANTEGQFASIMAHELAHLSQRHFARGVRQREEQRLPIYAGLLLGAVLAASGSGEGASAALASSQAAAAQQQLRYSREFESEADLEGLKNLAASGYGKTEMLDMFDVLRTQLGTRFGNKPPEYLLTHPLPDSRINEIRKRTINDHSPTHGQRDSLRFHLIKALTVNYYSKDSAQLVKSYQAQLSVIKARSDSQQLQVLRFGLASAYKDEHQYDKSQQIFYDLIKHNPSELAYHYELLDSFIKQGAFKRGLEHITRYPKIRSSYPIAISEVKVLNGLKRFRDAQQLLFKLIQQNNEAPLLWYMLAETSGQLQDIAQLHEARAEYFIRYNAMEKAKKQLNFALKDKRVQLSSARRAAIQYKIKWIEQTKKQQEKLGF